MATYSSGRHVGTWAATSGGQISQLIPAAPDSRFPHWCLRACSTMTRENQPNSGPPRRCLGCHTAHLEGHGGKQDDHRWTHSCPWNTKEEPAQSSHREGPSSELHQACAFPCGLAHEAAVGAMDGRTAYTSGTSTCTRPSDHGGSVVLGPEETVPVTHTHVHTTVQKTHMT